ncbi:hypothetical protein [Rhodococcus opacus]|uniref:hypothetical protein n=1 Tax=Rhodococcus opacus TaxID=37919 RepID=UPI0024760958|nr:hypothetical protein [Rhodococcus opacus]MDH6285540.1 hypothetical protein [Rhodococcus opacus]
MVGFFKLLEKYGVLKPLRNIVLAVAALVAVMTIVMWVGNPYADDAQATDEAASSWAPAPPTGPSTTVAPLPPGFPSMEFPPPMIEAPDGQPQPVPTKFGLTYTVPGSDDWRPSNSSVMSWSDDDGTIAGYGAVSDYGYRYCPEYKSSRLAISGATGRNGVDVDTAAREAVGKAERIFSDNAGGTPKVEIRGPVDFQVSGRPAVRYTAVVTDIPRDHSCDPTRAGFDIVATPAYATAEVMVFMIEHHVGLPDSLSDQDVDTIITSLHKTE